MRNKKKQKKLDKYLEEQDEEEREIIMKMRGVLIDLFLGPINEAYEKR